MRLSLIYGLPVLRRDFRLRRILAVRIWLNLLFLIGCVIGSREEHLCLVHVLFWSSDVVFLMWTKWTCCFVEVELCQILVSEVELGCGLMVVVFSQILGIWSGPWFEMWVCNRVWFLKWTFCSLLTLFGIRQSFVSEVDLAGVVVGTFSCWSGFNMRASVKHELLGHGFHDELFN